MADVQAHLRSNVGSYNVLCKELGVFSKKELDDYLAKDLDRWAVILLLERLDESLVVLAHVMNWTVA